MNQETLLKAHNQEEIKGQPFADQQLTTKEEKRGENIKFMLAIVFLMALVGAAIDILV